MKGTLVNFMAIIIGSGIGILLKNGITPTQKQTIMQGLGLAVLLIGLKMAITSEQMLIVIISLAAGAFVGECLGIDKKINRLGQSITQHLGTCHGDVGRGFVQASLLFCVGAMAIVGSLQEGLTGDASTIYAKAVIDGITALIFSAALGIGVALAAVSVLIYQGTITLGASLLEPLLTAAAIRELTAVGGLLIVVIALSMLELTKIRVANLLPAIPIAVLLVSLEIF